MKVYNIQYLFILVNNYVQDGFLHFMISSNELCKPEQKVKVFLHLYKVQVYKGIDIPISSQYHSNHQDMRISK